METEQAEQKPQTSFFGRASEDMRELDNKVVDFLNQDVYQIEDAFADFDETWNSLNQGLF